MLCGFYLLILVGDGFCDSKGEKNIRYIVC